MSCRCAHYDEDSGRYDCDVSGDQCMFLFPSAKRCAEMYGEGPDAPVNQDEQEDSEP